MDRIDVRIVDGFSNHDSKQTSLVIESILETSGIFNVSISTTLSESNSKK